MCLAGKGERFSLPPTAPRALSLAASLVPRLPPLPTRDPPSQILFNRFNSVLSSSPTLATVQSPAALERALAAGEAGIAIEQYEIEEENREEVLQDLSEFQLAAIVYNGFLENACSEMGARMNAMENSTNNASDMLGRLTLTYNRGRQAKITTELIEIISGASALEG